MAETHSLVRDFLNNIIADRSTETAKVIDALRNSYAEACRDLDEQIKACDDAVKNGDSMFDVYRAGIPERRARVESTRAQLEEAIDAEATLKEMLRELRIKLQKNQ